MITAGIEPATVVRKFHIYVNSPSLPLALLSNFVAPDFRETPGAKKKTTRCWNRTSDPLPISMFENGEHMDGTRLRPITGARAIVASVLSCRAAALPLS